MAKAPRKTFRKVSGGDDGSGPTLALVRIANVQVLCPHCKEVVGTEEGCAHWSLRLYRRFAGVQCGHCGNFLTFPEVLGAPGELDPREQVPEGE
jgi:hypothetical protein